MIDHDARRKMADAIRAYMNEEIGAFDFDDALSNASERTKDKTVFFIHVGLWSYFDDLKDHKICATKELWDHFHRMLLILESDSELERTELPRQWQARHFVAASSLAIAATIAWKTGFGDHLIILISIPLGVLSLAIGLWPAKKNNETARNSAGLAPFDSITAIRAARRRVPEFTKRPFPSHLAARRIRSPLEERITRLMSLPIWLIWFALAPLVLVFQTIPRRAVEWHVRTP